jgi:WD40 repeat protein
MVSGGYDNTIKVWRLSDNILLRTINPFDVGPYEGSLSIAPNGLWMAAIGQDNDGYKLKVFHTSDGSVIASYELAGRPGHTAFSPDSQTVVVDSANLNGSPTPVTFYPAAGGTPVPMIWYSGATPNAIGGVGVGYSPDGGSVALWYETVGGTGDLRVYPSAGPWTQYGYVDYGSYGGSQNVWSMSGFIGESNGTGPNIYAVSAECNPKCPSAYSESGSGEWTTFSPDGTHFSVGLSSGPPVSVWASLVTLTAGVWTHTAQIDLEPSPGGSTYPPWPTFSPDSGTLAVGTDTRIGLFQVSNGAFLNNVTSGSTYVYTTAYSPNGQMAASIADAVTGQPNLHIWNAQTGAQIAAVEDATVSYLYAYAETNAVFSPDNTLLAVTGLGVLNVYDTADGSLNRNLAISATGVAFSPDGTTFAVNGPTSTNSQFSLYSVKDGSLIKSVSYPGGYGPVAYAYDGSFILSTTQFGVDLRDPTSLTVSRSIKPGEEISAAALSPDSQTVAMAVYSKPTVQVYLYRIADGSLSGTLTAGASALQALAFSPDGHYVAGGGEDSVLYLWRTSDGILAQSYNQETGYLGADVLNLLSIAYSPDGTQLFYGRSDATSVMIANPLYLPFVESLTVPATVVGGSKVTGTVSLTAAATSPGIPVSLTSNNTAAKPTAGITVPTGAPSANFTIAAGLVSTPTPAVITATSGGRPVTATITVNPLVVSTLSLAPPTVTGGASSTGTVTLNGTAPAKGARVVLSSGNPAVLAPASVTVTDGNNSATFPISTTPVAADTTVKIQSTYNGVRVTAKLKVLAPVLAGITLDPTTVRGGQSSTANQVTLSGPAPAGGTLVTLSSNKPGVAAVPSSVTVPAGATSANFTVTTQTVTARTRANITANSGGVKESAALIVTP